MAEEKKPRWKRLAEAYRASQEACDELSKAIKAKAPPARLVILRKEWGRVYDEYARMRDDPSYTPEETHK